MPVREPRARRRVGRSVNLVAPLLGRLGHDRAVAIAVAGILLGASVVSLSGGRTAAATGGTDGPGTAPRIAVGGGQRRCDGPAGRTSGLVGAVEFGSPDPTARTRTTASPPSISATVPPRRSRTSVEGPFIDDGTLVKPVAVDTTVPDGSGLVRTYKVAGRRHAGRDRLQVRRLDDDGLVGERPEVEGRCKAGRTLSDPARDRADRHGRRHRHARRSRREVRASTAPTSSRPTGSTTRTSSSARSSSSRAPRARPSRSRRQGR